MAGRPMRSPGHRPRAVGAEVEVRARGRGRRRPAAGPGREVGPEGTSLACGPSGSLVRVSAGCLLVEEDPGQFGVDHRVGQAPAVGKPEGWLRSTLMVSGTTMLATGLASATGWSSRAARSTAPGGPRSWWWSGPCRCRRHCRRPGQLPRRPGREGHEGGSILQPSKRAVVAQMFSCWPVSMRLRGIWKTMEVSFWPVKKLRVFTNDGAGERSREACRSKDGSS